MPKPPSVFIGSSSEGHGIAETLQALLARYVEVTLWSQGIFGPNKGTLEELVAATSRFDFAVLILRPEDPVTKRQQKGSAPRDNVLFELGLFIGALGRERTFILGSDTSAMMLPSDLAGITIVRYTEQRSDDNMQAAVGSALAPIIDSIKKLGPRDPERYCKRLTNCHLVVKKGNILDCIHKDHTILLPANVFFDTSPADDLVDQRSTLGKRLSLFSKKEMAQFDGNLDAAISKSNLRSDPESGHLEGKVGRQKAYEPGSIVHVNSGQGPVLLLALTGLCWNGGRYIATLCDEGLTAALRRAWANLAANPVRGNLYMPIVGSGFGGITRSTALAHIFLSFRSAEAQSKSRICDTLSVIVFERDWGDRQWVRHIFEGLIA